MAVLEFSLAQELALGNGTRPAKQALASIEAAGALDAQEVIAAAWEADTSLDLSRAARERGWTIRTVGDVDLEELRTGFRSPLAVFTPRAEPPKAKPKAGATAA